MQENAKSTGWNYNVGGKQCECRFYFVAISLQLSRLTHLDSNSLVKLGEVGVVLRIENSKGHIKVRAVGVDDGMGVHTKLFLPFKDHNIMLLG